MPTTQTVPVEFNDKNYRIESHGKAWLEIDISDPNPSDAVQMSFDVCGKSAVKNKIEKKSCGHIVGYIAGGKYEDARSVDIAVGNAGPNIKLLLNSWENDIIPAKIFVYACMRITNIDDGADHLAITVRYYVQLESVLHTPFKYSDTKIVTLKVHKAAK